MTPEEIRQVYAAGPEAVVALVTSLLSHHQSEIALLTARVQDLEARLAKDSHNSGKPPSSDGLTKPAPKSLRLKSGRRPGGQPGHPGTTLGWAETPDQIIEHWPERCASCAEPLTPVATVAVERRFASWWPNIRPTPASAPPADSQQKPPSLQAWTPRCSTGHRSRLWASI